MPPVKISLKEYEDSKHAYEDGLTCAKVYKKLIDEGLFHPDTDIVLGEDGSGNLTLIIRSPELKLFADDKKPKMMKKFKKIEKKFSLDEIRDDMLENLTDFTKYHLSINEANLKNGLMWDMKLGMNWGIDEKTEEPYAHDMHIVKLFGSKNAYRIILEMAKYMGIK